MLLERPAEIIHVAVACPLSDLADGSIRITQHPLCALHPQPDYVFHGPEPLLLLEPPLELPHAASGQRGQLFKPQLLTIVPSI